MRVLHVYSGNLFGGIETMLLTLARRREACAMVEPVFALCFGGRLRDELALSGAEVRVLPETRASRPHTVRRARRALAGLLATDRVDWVVCHAPWAQALFGGVAKRAGTPVAFYVHDAFTGRHWTERWARRTRPDLILANSRYTAASAAGWFPGVASSVVFPPVDVDTPVLTVAERAAIRRQLETPPEHVVIVQASRMEAWKGHRGVLEALRRLRRVPGWTWWVTGGAQRPGEAAYRDRLVTAAEDLGVAARVRWLGERADVRRVLAAADLYCQVNRSPEPFGIAYVEALAAGLPVVAARAGGAAEIVDDSCGMLVPAGDPAALASALARLIADASLRATLGRGGPARARRLSSPATQIEALARALEDIAAVVA
jgi:glycosyltransferase involved in cell wall biosynthesis